MTDKELIDIENCIHDKVYKLCCEIVKFRIENAKLKEEIKKAYERMDAIEQALEGESDAKRMPEM